MCWLTLGSMGCIAIATSHMHEYTHVLCANLSCYGNLLNFNFALLSPYIHLHEDIGVVKEIRMNAINFLYTYIYMVKPQINNCSEHTDAAVDEQNTVSYICICCLFFVLSTSPVWHWMV